MAEYIERKAFIAYVRKEAEGLHTKMPMDLVIESVANEAKAFPAADVAPIRHGRWKRGKYTDVAPKDIEFYYCSACGHRLQTWRSKYLPNCGALMDKEVDDGDV